MALFIYCSHCGLSKRDHEKLELEHKWTARVDDSIEGDARHLIMAWDFGVWKRDTGEEVYNSIRPYLTQLSKRLADRQGGYGS